MREGRQRESLAVPPAAPPDQRVKVLPRKALAVTKHSQGTGVAAAALLNLEGPPGKARPWARDQETTARAGKGLRLSSQCQTFCSL